jgi:phosphoribosylformylglycinamidine synthase subunit PurS
MTNASSRPFGAISKPAWYKRFHHRARVWYHNSIMTAHVYVSLKKTVLDPQGATIYSALRGLGYQSVAAVRQGKHFELQLNSGITKEQAREQVERIAKEVLTNPVIEEFSYQLED